MLKAIFIIILITFMTYRAYAKDFGIHGEVRPIQEENFIKVIQERVTSYINTHGLESLKQKIIDNFKQGFDKKEAILPQAEDNNIWYFDPTITTEELVDEKGDIIEGSSKTINPLNFISVSKTLIFIDATVEVQRNYVKEKLLKQGNYKVILVNGNPIDLTEELEQPVYYDYNLQLVNRLKLKAVPSIVEQDGMVLKVTEVALKEVTNETY